MFGFIKNIFQKSSGGAAAATLAVPAPEMPIPMPASRTPRVRVEVPPAEAVAPPPSVAPAPVSNDRVIVLPLALVLASLPAMIRKRIPAEATHWLSIPVEKILPQLSTGAVSLTVGDLSAAAPEGLFGDGSADDQTPVPLPLGAVMKELNLALLSRRSHQQRLEVPDEVGSIFGQKGQTVSIAAPPKEEYRRSPAPVPLSDIPQPSSPASQRATNVVSAPPIPPSRPVPMPSVPAVAAASVPIPMSGAPATTPIAPVVRPVAVAVSEPAPMPPARSVVADAANALRVPLSSVSPGWPVEVREEIEQMNLAFGSLALPLSEVEQGLKTGQVIFAWKDVHSWIRPAVATKPSLAYGEMLLELPLKILAPLFLGQHRSAPPQRKTVVGEDIPDVFSPAARKPEIPVVASGPPAIASSFAFPSPPASVSAVAPVPATAVPVAAVPVAPVAVDLADILGEPESRHSADQIVQNTMKLPGVSGVLLAMNDGLLVASALPPQVKGEMMAAFLPQIFGRMNQYAKELVLGELQTISLTVTNGSWQVFKSGQIFFAVSGRPGEQLSISPLSAIAAELGRQQK